VSYHTILVGICNGPRLEPAHRVEGDLHRRSHTGKEVIGEVHPADVKRNPEGGKVAEIFLEAFPRLVVVHRMAASSRRKLDRFLILSQNARIASQRPKSFISSEALW
jgi:hypothetical protein